MKKDTEHILVNTVELLPTTQMHGFFTYIMSEAAVLNIFGSTGGRVPMLVMTVCGNFALNWIFCVDLFVN